MNWTRENIAWLAGLFEGEGSLSPRVTRGGRRAWALAITMTDEDVIQRAHAIAGFGNVGGPYCRGDRKPYWTLAVTRRAWVFALVVAMWPWLGERRRATVREALAELPPVGYYLRGDAWVKARAPS